MSDFLENLFKTTKVETKPVTQSVSVTIEKTQLTPDGPIKEVQEKVNETKQVETKLMEKEVVYISMEMGASINLGNYSNGKVKVGVHLPVGLEFTPELNSKLEQTFGLAKAWVEKKVEHEVSELAKLRGKI